MHCGRVRAQLRVNKNWWFCFFCFSGRFFLDGYYLLFTFSFPIFGSLRADDFGEITDFVNNFVNVVNNFVSNFVNLVKHCQHSSISDNFGPLRRP